MLVYREIGSSGVLCKEPPQGDPLAAAMGRRAGCERVTEPTVLIWIAIDLRTMTAGRVSDGGVAPQPPRIMADQGTKPC